VYSKACIRCEIFCKTVVEKADARNWHPEARCVLLIAFNVHNIEMKFMRFKVSVFRYCTRQLNKFIFIRLSLLRMKRTFFF